MSEHYSKGRQWSYISHAWILDSRWNDKEEVARLRAKIEDLERKLIVPSDEPKNTRALDSRIAYSGERQNEER